MGTNEFKKGFDPRRKIFTKEERFQGSLAAVIKKKESYINADWSELPLAEKRRRILKEQDGACLGCDIKDVWNGKPISLELDHINGNNKDNSRENLRILCPNCHSQTPTFRRKKVMRV